jgi:hypothetical protein
MSTCLDCKFADWKRTASGRFHPSGEGMCRHVWEPPPISAAHCFDFGSRNIPRPRWGQIDRKKPYQTSGEGGCKVFQRKEQQA